MEVGVGFLQIKAMAGVTKMKKWREIPFRIEMLPFTRNERRWLWVARIKCISYFLLEDKSVRNQNELTRTNMKYWKKLIDSQLWLTRNRQNFQLWKNAPRNEKKEMQDNKRRERPWKIGEDTRDWVSDIKWSLSTKSDLLSIKMVRFDCVDPFGSILKCLKGKSFEDGQNDIIIFF